MSSRRTRWTRSVDLCVAPVVFAATVASGIDTAAATAAQAPASGFVEIVEYHHAGLDHYFITADRAEASRLDAGVLAGWARTGFRFVAPPFDAASPAEPVCRFYGRPEAKLDSHFYSADAAECTEVQARFGASWQFESSDVFRMMLPDRATGQCAARTLPVYRLFNGRVDANHRYTSDWQVRAAMIADGHVPEGHGSDGVAFCVLSVLAPGEAPAPNPVPDQRSLTVADIAVTPATLDTYDFYALARAADGAAIVSHAWNFGDGTAATGAAASHRYTVSGTYPVVLTVTDSRNRVTTAMRNVAANVEGAAASPLPAWRRQLPRDVFTPIPNTATMNGTTSNTATLNAWNGLAAGPTTWWSVANGGHEDSPENKVLRIDLAESAPRWKVVHPGSTAANIPPKANLLYYPDGLPASRHTYYAAQYIGARNRVMLFNAAAVWGNGNGGGPVVDGFRLADSKWDPEGTWSRSPVPQTIAQTVAKHPVTEDVYAAHSGVFAKWTQATGTWSIVNPGRGPQWQFQGSVIDASRNRWVYMDATKVLGLIDLRTHLYSTLPLTGIDGDAPFKSYNAIVHDLDNDRYLTISDERVYAIDPTTGATTKIATVPAPVNGVQSRFAYFRELGGVAYLPSFASPILFMPTR